MDLPWPLSELPPETLVAEAMQRLEADPDGPLVDRVAWGVIIASAGDPENRDATFGQVAEIVGCSVGEVHQALFALKERAE